MKQYKLKNNADHPGNGIIFKVYFPITINDELDKKYAYLSNVMFSRTEDIILKKLIKRKYEAL